MQWFCLHCLLAVLWRGLGCRSSCTASGKQQCCRLALQHQVMLVGTARPTWDALGYDASLHLSSGPGMWEPASGMCCSSGTTSLRDTCFNAVGLVCPASQTRKSNRAVPGRKIRWWWPEACKQMLCALDKLHRNHQKGGIFLLIKISSRKGFLILTE